MTQAKNNICRCFGVLALINLLIGCASLELENGTWADTDDKSVNTQTDKTIPVDENTENLEQTGRPLSGKELEQSAANKQYPEKEELLLFAASAYLDKSNFAKTAQLLNTTSQTQPPELLYLRQQALYSALYIEQNELDKAEQIIRSLKQYKNKDPVFNDWIILAESKLLQRRGDFLQSLELLNLRVDSIHPSQKQSHQDKIWQLITQQNLETLNQSRLKTSKQLELGWIELGIIDRKRDLTPPSVWQQSLALWRNTYQDHPASAIHQQIAGNSSTELDESIFRTNETIALLLPLSSSYQEIAETIRDGFMAASIAKGQKVKVYDTGSTVDHLTALYQQAISQGAQIIVGPLGKAGATKLAADTEIVRPTILLGTVNASENTILSSHAFMFSLDPEHEAESIAKRAYNRGYNRAAVLYPNSGRGKRLNNAFTRRWRQLGGTITSAVVYDNELYEAETPVNRLLAGPSSPDIIFLASSSQQGRLLSQVINKRRPNTAIFATSSIYSGQSDPTRDFVLDNVIFTDMPWMITGFYNAQFRKQQLAAERFESPNSLDRYYAFGVDAYALASRLPQFINQPGASIKGVTGNIQLLGNRFTLTRPLVQFVEGTPRPTN